MQTRNIIIGAIVISVLLFAVGLAVGYFAISKTTESISYVEYLQTDCTTTQFDDKWNKYKNKYLQESADSSCYQETCNNEDLPRTYISYHLNGKTINIDGKLDDPAWTEVPWSQSFMVWTDNSVEAHIVPDGSFHNYKQIQINVLNVTWDLKLNKAYMDFGCNGGRATDIYWDGDLKKATFTDGIINDINSRGTYWSAEWSFTFDRLAQTTERQAGKSTPDENESWFINFARAQYQYKIVNGKYAKDESVQVEWWSWQPMYAVNLHLPSRNGLVQFKRNMDHKTFSWKKWHLYRALLEVFYAEHKFKSINGMFTDELSLLELAPKIMSTSCVDISVTLGRSDFTVTVVSK